MQQPATMRHSHSASSLLRLLPRKSPCVSRDNSSSNLMQRYQQQQPALSTASEVHCTPAAFVPSSTSYPTLSSPHSLGSLLSARTTEPVTPDRSCSPTLHQDISSVSIYVKFVKHHLFIRCNNGWPAYTNMQCWLSSMCFVKRTPISIHGWFGKYCVACLRHHKSRSTALM